jgi:exodeoxyribonuclease-5
MPDAPVIPEFGDFTPDQVNAIETLVQWAEDPLRPQSMTLGGYAGTGKTTVIRYLLMQMVSLLHKKLGRPGVIAPTGKAADVLRRKGIFEAQTFHSAIYQPVDVLDGVAYIKKPELPFSWLICDEASMVTTDMYVDALSFHVPILWVGDMGQLEPVGENPQIMADPMIRLEQIHRQAEGSDIIRLSKWVREGRDPRQFIPTLRAPGTPPQVVIGTSRDFDNSLIYADHVMCGFNRTRIGTNRWFRNYHKRGPDPEAGDKVICLQNNKYAGVFNGMMGKIVEVRRKQEPLIFCDVEDESGNVLSNVSMWLEQFNNEQNCWAKFRNKLITYWDYAGVVTVHKSQGSEYAKVLVKEELHPDWAAARWRYTAVTRASSQLVYCCL